MDAFADPEFRERAGKLFRLLASDAAGEAEAARGALLRLLARHDSSLDELAERALGPPAHDGPVLRAAFEDASRRARLADAARQTAAAEAVRWRAAAQRLRLVCAGVGGVAALVVGLAWLPGRPKPVPARLVVVPRTAPFATRAEPFAPPALATRAAPLVATAGHVSPVEGTPLRAELTPSFPPITVLPQGTRVTIDQAFPLYGRRWLQVRTPHGAGFVAEDAIELE